MDHPLLLRHPLPALQDRQHRPGPAGAGLAEGARAGILPGQGDEGGV